MAADSFEDLFARVAPQMRRLLSAYRIPPEDAEDIVQQTLLAFLYQREKIRDPDRWVLGTMKRHCLMYWRTQRRRLYLAVDGAILEWLSEPVPSAQERKDLLCDLESLIERLPARCRSLLKLRFKLGYEPSEVAERLGYRASSIGKITTRCLAALSRELMAAGITADDLQEASRSRKSSADADQAGEPEVGKRAVSRR